MLVYMCVQLVYQSPTLASLSLSRNRFRDSGAGAIFQAMLCEGGARKAHSTASAAASAGKVTAPQSRDDGDVSAAHALLTGGGSRSARGLTSLDLTQNRLTSSSAAVLASVLMDPKSRNAMRILDLRYTILDGNISKLTPPRTRSHFTFTLCHSQPKSHRRFRCNRARVGCCEKQRANIEFGPQQHRRRRSQTHCVLRTHLRQWNQLVKNQSIGK